MSNQERVKQRLEENGIVSSLNLLFNYGILPKESTKAIKNLKKDGYIIFSTKTTWNYTHVWPDCINNSIF